MNVKCDECKGRGVIQRDGKLVGNHQPYTLICPVCQGVGHYRITGSTEDIEAKP